MCGATAGPLWVQGRACFWWTAVQSCSEPTSVDDTGDISSGTDLKRWHLYLGGQISSEVVEEGHLWEKERKLCLCMVGPAPTIPVTMGLHRRTNKEALFRFCQTSFKILLFQILVTPLYIDRGRGVKCSLSNVTSWEHVCRSHLRCVYEYSPFFVVTK